MLPLNTLKSSPKIKLDEFLKNYVRLNSCMTLILKYERIKWKNFFEEYNKLYYKNETKFFYIRIIRYLPVTTYVH